MIRHATRGLSSPNGSRKRLETDFYIPLCFMFNIIAFTLQKISGTFHLVYFEELILMSRYSRLFIVFQVPLLHKKCVMLLKKLLRLLIMNAHTISFGPGENPGKTNRLNSRSSQLFFRGICSIH